MSIEIRSTVFSKLPPLLELPLTFLMFLFYSRKLKMNSLILRKKKIMTTSPIPHNKMLKRIRGQKLLLRIRKRKLKEVRNLKLTRKRRLKEWAASSSKKLLRTMKRRRTTMRRRVIYVTSIQIDMTSRINTIANRIYRSTLDLISIATSRSTKTNRREKIVLRRRRQLVRNFPVMMKT